MTSRMGYLVTGIIALILIVPAMVAVENVAGGRIVEDQVVTREENDEFETKWLVEYLDDTDGEQEYEYWAEEKPTENEATNEIEDETGDTVDSIEDIEAVKEDATIYPVAPWLASLLEIIVPLTLVAGAIYSFSRIVSGPGAWVKQKIGSFKTNLQTAFNYGKTVGQRGQVGGFGNLIGLFIGVLFAVILLVRMTPIIYEEAKEMSGVWGAEYLVTFIPFLLVIAVFYKLFDEIL